MPEAHAGMMVTPSVKLVRPLGEGGMGAVWVADHLALRTQVVVKFIAEGLRGSKDAHERFSREAAAASQVKSPHVVQTFDHGITEDGVPYIVMELLEGRDLGAYIDAEKRLPLALAVEIITQLSRALDRAHERGIIHRDIKPGNIFLCDAGRGEIFVKLLDFGIAKGVEAPKVDSNTKTGSMIGSPYYMSPEQILGSKGVDHRSDLWSVGVVAYEALTGNKPFDAETVGGLAIRIHSEPLPLPSTVVPELPAAVDAWFQRACARNVDERFASAKEMAEAFVAAAGGQMPKVVAAPRITTGSSDVSSGAPTLVAGATTDAGVVRPPPPASTRSRVLILAGTIAVLGLATFAVVRLASPKPSDGHALVPPTPSTTIQPERSASAAPVGSLATAPAASSAPPPSVTVKAGAGQVARPRLKDSGHTAAVPPLPSQAPPVSTARPPASGHDIF